MIFRGCGSASDGRRAGSGITCSADLRPDEQPLIDEAVKRAADAAEMFANENILAAMNRYNAAPAANEDQA